MGIRRADFVSFPKAVTFTFSIFFLFSLFIFQPLAFSNDEEERKSWPSQIVTIPFNKVIHGDYFAFGKIVEISGTVNGDVYAAGKQIFVDGTVNGDLLAAGGILNISGTISQDARIAGGNVNITGNIHRNLSIAGGNIDLARTANIEGGIVAAGGNISVAAPIGTYGKIAAGNVVVSNIVNGNLHVAAGALRLTSNAFIDGNVTVWSDRPGSIDEGARITGEVIHKMLPEFKRPSAEEALGILAGGLFILKIISFVSTLIVGLLLIRFFPNYHQQTQSTLREKPWASLGIGFISLVMGPIILFILFGTVVGIPIALIFGALFLISLYLGRIVMIVWIGSVLFDLFGKIPREGWALFVGLIIYFLVTLIPFLGGLICFLVLFFGLGSALLAEKEVYSAARRKEVF